MRATKPDEKPPSVDRAASVLTRAEDKEMQRFDANGDGVFDEEEQPAAARVAAALRASNSWYKKFAFIIVMLMVLSWIGNAFHAA